MKAKRTVYLVTDYGGEWDDAWEFPYMVFENEHDAEACADKRSKRDELNGDAYDRRYSRVIPVDILMEEETCRNVYDEMVCGSCDNGFECSVCGEKVEDEEHYHVSGTWNFCPNCRRKVVE